jgi:hypothetical protein
MRSTRPELIKQMTDVLDEIIPAIPVDDRTSALVARRECVLKAAAVEQASYEDSVGCRLSRNGRNLEREQARLLLNRRSSAQGRYKSVTTIPRSPIRLRANRPNDGHSVCEPNAMLDKADRSAGRVIPTPVQLFTTKRQKG